jgi:hypothetical protein
VHLVSFTTEIYYDARSYKSQIKSSVYGGVVVVLAVIVNFCFSNTKLEQPKCGIIIKPNCTGRLTKAENRESATERDVFLVSIPTCPRVT